MLAKDTVEGDSGKAAGKDESVEANVEVGVLFFFLLFLVMIAFEPHFIFSVFFVGEGGSTGLEEG